MDLMKIKMNEESLSHMITRNVLKVMNEGYADPQVSKNEATKRQAIQKVTQWIKQLFNGQMEGSDFEENMTQMAVTLKRYLGKRKWARGRDFALNDINYGQR